MCIRDSLVGCELAEVHGVGQIRILALVVVQKALKIDFPNCFLSGLPLYSEEPAMNLLQYDLQKYSRCLLYTSLGISDKTAYALLRDNKIEHFKVGRTYKIPKIHICLLYTSAKSV